MKRALSCPEAALNLLKDFPEARAVNEDEERRISALQAACSGEGLEDVASSRAARCLYMRLVRQYTQGELDNEKSIEAVRRILQWRREVKADSELVSRRHKGYDAFHKAWPALLGGTDVFGHPLWVERIRDLRVRDLCPPHFAPSDILLLRGQAMESLQLEKERISEAAGHTVHRHVYVMDLRGMDLSLLNGDVRAVLRLLICASGDYYTETCWRLYCLNTPLAFRAIWAIMRSWIRPETVRRFSLLGGPGSYLRRMQEDGIPLESIPEALGGKHPGRPFTEIIEQHFAPEERRGPAAAAGGGGAEAAAAASSRAAAAPPEEEEAVAAASPDAPPPPLSPSFPPDRRGRSGQARRSSAGSAGLLDEAADAFDSALLPPAGGGAGAAECSLRAVASEPVIARAGSEEAGDGAGGAHGGSAPGLLLHGAPWRGGEKRRTGELSCGAGARESERADGADGAGAAAAERERAAPAQSPREASCGPAASLPPSSQLETWPLPPPLVPRLSSSSLREMAAGWKHSWKHGPLFWYV